MTEQSIPPGAILGLHLSPRRSGSSMVLLEEFAKGAALGGRATKIVSTTDLGAVEGCRECGSCELTGECVIQDELRPLFPLLEAAERIVVSSSVFFYGPPAQGKAVIDRSQAFWARRRLTGRLRLTRPGTKGFLLAVGATKGDDLFLGTTLTIKYFFDALGLPKTFDSLVFRKIENPGELTPPQLAAVREAGTAYAQS
ncbi:MAG: flavodoxin family protein [Deltaproteobacteria bacterium]|jgi:multimeric flavodoxin WrbA|nr:flavodoxin family protein [Deltaproteobacteria bacterium]